MDIGSEKIRHNTGKNTNRIVSVHPHNVSELDISQLKKYSDYAHDIEQIKRNALEKMRSRQIIAYNSRLFRADVQTINVVQTFKAHSDTFYMLDVNDNPCHITNPDEFLKLLIERNQEALNVYHQLFEDLKMKGTNV